MANENTRFYMTAKSEQAGGDNVVVATGDAGANSAIVEVTFTKSSFETGAGRSQLLKQLEQIMAKIQEVPWKAI
jgi:hypothetical protein